MTAHNPFIEYYESQALGKHHQTGHGLYIDLPWQKGYGNLKPFAKAVEKRLLRART